MIKRVAETVFWGAMAAVGWITGSALFSFIFDLYFRGAPNSVLIPFVIALVIITFTSVFCTLNCLGIRYESKSKA